MLQVEYVSASGCSLRPLPLMLLEEPEKNLVCSLLAVCEFEFLLGRGIVLIVHVPQPARDRLAGVDVYLVSCVPSSRASVQNVHICPVSQNGISSL